MFIVYAYVYQAAQQPKYLLTCFDYNFKRYSPEIMCLFQHVYIQCNKSHHPYTVGPITQPRPRSPPNTAKLYAAE